MGITIVEVISAGPQGAPGTPGASTEPGGTTNQVLAKVSNTDFDVAWITPDAANAAFSSTEGLIATTVGTAIDEVEANRKINTTAINTNAADITTNVSNIATNSSNIVSLTTSVLTNTTDIATNTADIVTANSGIADNAVDIAALDVRLTAEEAYVDSAISVGTSTAKATQTLVPDTPEVLLWMTDALVDAGGTAIGFDIPTSEIRILETGIYKIFGNLTLTAPINDIVEMFLYIDNLPSGITIAAIGRGNDLPISFPNTFMTHFDINDEVTLYIKSTGTEITVQSASVSVEATKY